MWSNATKAFNDKLNEYSRTFKARLVFSDATSVQVSTLTYTHGIVGSETVTLGGAVSSMITGTILGNAPVVLKGREVVLEIGVELTSDNYEYIPMGTYKITASPALDGGGVKFTAYDAVYYKYQKLYIPTEGIGTTTTEDKTDDEGNVIETISTTTATISEVLADISTQLGITISNTCNTALTTSKVKVLGGYYYAEMLGYLASSLGGVFYVDRVGVVTLAPIGTRGALGIDGDRYFSLTKGEEDTQIDGVVVSTSANTYTHGGGASLAVSNPILLEESAEAMANTVIGTRYRPVSTSFLGDIRLDPNDTLSIITPSGENYTTPVMQITHTFDGGITTTVTSYEVNEVESEVGFTGTLTQQVERAYSEALLAKTLVVNKADIGDLNAVKGTIGSLEVDTAKINKLIFGQSVGESISVDFATAIAGAFKNAVIKSAMIESLSVDKIASGTISTNKFKIASDDGRLGIADNTIQIQDANRVRIQIGKDSTGDYNLSLWDIDGKKIWDAKGVTADGIRDGLIDNDMISNTASISGTKINLPSLVKEINDSTQTIKASHIMYDADKQTLDVAFQTIKTTVGTLGDNVSTLQTNLSTTNGKVSSLITSTETLKTDVSTVKTNASTALSTANTANGNASTAVTKVNSLEQTLGQFKVTVGETYTTKSDFNNLTVGGRNLIKNSDNGYLDNLGVDNGGDVIKNVSNVDGWRRIELNSQLINKEIVQEKWVYGVQNGETYTFSILCRSDATSIQSKVSWYTYKHGHCVTTCKVSKVGDNLFKISATHTLTNGEGIRVVDLILFTTKGATFVEFRYPKLEVGKIATDWTKAPEDIDTRVDTLQSSIMANANAINLKVSKNDIISTINQSAEAVTINASKINLQGYVTASDLAGTGQTIINGANIKSGTIEGITIKGSEIIGANIVSEYWLDGDTVATGIASFRNGCLHISQNEGRSFEIGFGARGQIEMMFDDEGFTHITRDVVSSPELHSSWDAYIDHDLSVGHDVFTSGWYYEQGKSLRSQYLRYSADSEGYNAPIFQQNNTNWLRTPPSGLLPNVKGTSSAIGTRSWRFNSAYFNTTNSNYVRIDNNQGASETSASHGLQIGATNSANLRLDGNDIVAVNNGALSAFYIKGASIGLCADTNCTGYFMLNNAKQLLTKNSSGSQVEIAKVGTNNNANLFSNYTSGSLYIGSLDNGGTRIRGKNVQITSRASGEDSYVLQLMREAGTNDTSDGRSILRCTTNGKMFLGSSGYRFNTAFFTNAITASDRKYKCDFKALTDDDKSKAFIMGLEPTKYHFNPDESDSNSTRWHLGFVAQDVAKLAKATGIGDLSMYQASIMNEDGTESPYKEGMDVDDSRLNWGLNYNDFIAPLVAVVQQQERRITELETKLSLQ